MMDFHTNRHVLSQASADDMGSFVAISNGQFAVNCKTFYVSGWNQWETVEAAAGALELFGASLPPDTTGPALVRRLLDRAVANGFSVVRAWATAVSPQYALEVSGLARVCWEGVGVLLGRLHSCSGHVMHMHAPRSWAGSRGCAAACCTGYVLPGHTSAWQLEHAVAVLPVCNADLPW